METIFQIYVGTYAKYNDGSLFGEWFDLSDYSDKDEFIDACLKLHADEEDPELMFQDWEGVPATYISESDIDADFWDIINSRVDIDALLAFIDCTGDKDIENFENAYEGEWESEEDFAQYLFDEQYTGTIPNEVLYYIDYGAYARDLFSSDYVYSDGYVFNNNF